MIILQANDFVARDELDRHIESSLQNESILAEEYEIHGTREELKRLKLSGNTTVYKVKCVVTDSNNEVRQVHEKPDRGKQTDFGIEGKPLIKNPNLK